VVDGLQDDRESILLVDICGKVVHKASPSEETEAATSSGDCAGSRVKVTSEGFGVCNEIEVTDRGSVKFQSILNGFQSRVSPLDIVDEAKEIFRRETIEKVFGSEGCAFGHLYE